MPVTAQRLKTAEKTSMPARGDRPGHKIGRNDLRYWLPGQVVRDTKGFPDKCIALPTRAAGEADDAFEERIAAACREHTVRLLAWLDNPQRAAFDPNAVYDGSMGSLCRIYKGHPFSPYHEAKHNTRKYYDAYLDLVEATIGGRAVRNVDLFTAQNWYKQWRRPAAPGEDERIDRAHDAISEVRKVVNFCARLKNFTGRKVCQELAADLKGVKFEKGGAREEEMTLAYVRAFIETALDMGRRGILPFERARSVAISVTATFELMLRPMDVIGEWVQEAANHRFPKGASLIRLGTEIWGGFFTWENLAGWRWRTKTSKSKYRSAADFDLTRYDLLMPLLEAVPHGERIGSIVKGEHGLPARQSTIGKDYRQIARAAGIPDEVRWMDGRAGGATEADEAGAALGDISGALTHRNTDITVRYLRRGSSRKIANVADARKKGRTAEGQEG